MATFLSDAWLGELARAAEGVEVPADADLVVQQIVHHENGSESAYAIVVGEGRLTMVPGRVESCDVSFTQDRATAAAIARGELSAQAAFLAGRLRIGGDAQRLAGQAALLAGLADAFGALRSSTTW